MDLIQHSQVDKVAKLLDRGFDPNYHDSDTGGKAAQSRDTDPETSVFPSMTIKYPHLCNVVRPVKVGPQLGPKLNKTENKAMEAAAVFLQPLL